MYKLQRVPICEHEGPKLYDPTRVELVDEEQRLKAPKLYMTVSLYDDGRIKVWGPQSRHRLVTDSSQYHAKLRQVYGLVTASRGRVTRAYDQESESTTERRKEMRNKVVVYASKQCQGLGNGN